PLYVSCLSAQCLTGRRLCVVGGWAVPGSACQGWRLSPRAPFARGTHQETRLSRFNLATENVSHLAWGAQAALALARQLQASVERLTQDCAPQGGEDANTPSDHH